MIPQIWVGRDQEINDWTRIVRPSRIAGVYERSRTILGEPGVGKSSLVNLISREAKEQGDWVTDQLRIPPATDALKRVAEALLAIADQAGLSTSTEKGLAALLDRVRSIAALGVSVSLAQPEGEEPYVALTDLLVEIGRAAIKAKVVVLICIDEIQNITDEAILSQLLISLGDALTKEVTVIAPGDREITRFLPIAVYLSGLPDFEHMARTRQRATFARRFKTTYLSSVTTTEMEQALAPLVNQGWEISDEEGGIKHVYMDQDARDAIIDLSKGEPFLFQLAGNSAWRAGNTDTITREDVLAGWQTVRDEAESHVANILDRLPEQERLVVEIMGELDPAERTLSAIADAAGISPATKLGTAARRLEKVRGIITRGKPYAFRNRAIEAYLTSEWPEITP
ncbi:ATP-binding protein [Corynebacterium sp. 22KM0430]|uniref:ATP-binding protein n=1 Tax=Corynebacterium sp. 22KM0430 TaxID=2989735 RepID=UPI0029CA8028|nr:ATP-binding protein [Corynebacterium sp. 22KM0430]WPF65903.1 ATP-binding protein [Corynebacterium sp. 22KM0430]